MHDLIAYLIKHNPFIQFIYRKVMSAVFRIWGKFVKADEKLVLFSSFGGKQYSDSPRVLFEHMKRDDRFREYQFVWALENPDSVEIPGASKVKIDSLSYFKTALKARIWITNVNIERGLNFKPQNTIYLNTWHGTGPKKGGNAVKGRKDYDFSKVDIFCCDGDYNKEVFTKWFGAKEENMLWCGRPREDELMAMSEEDARETRVKLGLPDDKKIILYMPTWREKGNREIDFDYWKRELGEEYVLMVRSHHFSKSKLLVQDGVWNVTDYPNVNELYVVADVLISDYSSAFFDFGLLGKPIFCYAYDYEQYQKEPGLFMDLKNEFPNGIFETEEELVQYIKNMNYEREAEISDTYIKSYVTHEQDATKACLDRIEQIMKEKRK